ncbi:MAG: ribosome-associated translation inhibitor RaiA [Xanthomonadales bacterium]|nr:ribosome-associated translation inhibitor RaiA [Xanthomonadales bacterium]
MKIVLTGRQIDVTPALNEYVHSKFDRLSRHSDDVINVQVVLECEKLEHKAEATIHLRGRTVHANAEGVDMYAAIDLLADKLDRQVIKHKERATDHHRSEAQKAASF